ncbi:MAG: DsbA family protein [Candidatus Limnocylindrales bacterium]
MSSSSRSPAPPDSRRARRDSQRSARREARDRDLAKRRKAEASRVSPMMWLTGAAVVIALLVIGFLVVSNQHGSSATIIAPTVSSPPALANGTTLGSSGAPVTVDIWADFQCPYCAEFTTLEQPQLVTTYVATGQAKMAFHNYAFIGPESTAAAIAATCAGQQDQFWPYHDYLYANQGVTENSGAFSEDRLNQIATEVGLDMGAFKTCTADPATAAAVKAEHAQGAALGVSGTPAIFVNGKLLNGYDPATVTAAIDAALGTATPGPLPSGFATASPRPSPSPALSPSPSTP